MFWDNERTAFNLNKLELNCSKILLIPGDKNVPSIEGVGSIFQKEDGFLYLKVYANVPHIWQLFKQSQTSIVAGQLIPPTYFYKLEATDAEGRIWKSHRTRLDYHAASNNFTVFTGTLESITYECAPPKHIEKPYIKMNFYQQVKIPANNFTETTFSIADQKKHSSSELKGWKFESHNFNFLLWDEESCLHLCCNSQEITDFPEHFEIRIVEALGFITGENLIWSYFERGKGPLIEIILKSKPSKKSTTRLLPPISYDLIMNAKEVQKLFSLYLKHILNYSNSDWHPITQNHYAILSASGGSISTEALTLGVEIEGLAKGQLSNYHPKQPSQDVLNTSIEKISELELNQEIKKRILGFIGSLPGIKGQNILKNMVSLKIITEEQFENWKKLRHPAAHSDPFDSSKFQDYIDLCHANTVLFYHLIFHLIGYTGIYTNYGRHGFPEGVYNPPVDLIGETI